VLGGGFIKTAIASADYVHPGDEQVAVSAVRG